MMNDIIGIDITINMPAMFQHPGKRPLHYGGVTMKEIISGIYEIRNTVNEHIYIGSAVNIHTRWNLHKNELRKGVHHSVYLQRAWNKYGETNFVFSVLRLVDGKEERLIAEQEYLDKFIPEYNMARKAGSRQGVLASEETKEKMRLAGLSVSNERRESRLKNMLEVVIPSAKKWHGTDEGIAWHKNNYKNNYAALHAKHLIICDQCGKEKEVEKGRFCSNACKSKWRRDNHLDDVTKSCAICGNDFTSNKYHKSETCSAICRGKLLWKRISPESREAHSRKVSEARRKRGQ